MARLPQPGGDNGSWGNILNDYLSQTLKSDGTVKDNAITNNAIAPNAVTAAEIANDAVGVTQIADGSITEALLTTAVQNKLNAVAGTPDWSTIMNKPAVIAAGADQAAARTSIGAGTSSLVIGTTSSTAKAGDYTPTNIPESAVTGLTTDLAAKANNSVTITGAISLTGGGDLSANRTISLVGDAATPGNTKYYGTNGSGTKGYYDVPSGGSVTSTSITDSTATGRSLITATNAAAARTTVGLGSVDNTSDVAKPISTLTQTALNAKRDMITPEQYGAVGNGTTDDTTALANMFAAAGGKMVYLNPTRQYKHTAVLTISANAVFITGGGTLLATAEQTSEVLVTGNYVTMENVTLKMSSTTQRWTEYEKMKLRINGDYFIARNLTIDGSAAAGIMIENAGNFLLNAVEVFGTRADGIHCTGDSHDGSIIGCYVHDTGDDSFAVVSYEQDGVQCNNIVNIGSYSSNSAARGFSVVGGTNIRLYNGRVDSSAAAAIYVACEPSFTTYGVSDVVIEGFELRNSNTAASTVNQGAILIYNGRSASYLIQRLTIRDVTIRDTNTSASRQIGLLCDTNGADNIRDVILAGISLTGTGPTYRLDLYQVPTYRCQASASLLDRRVYTTSSYTARGGIDQVVLIGAGGSVILPTAVGNVNRYTIKNVDSSSKTVSTTGGQTISGSSTQTVTAGSQIDIISDNANWFIL